MKNRSHLSIGEVLTLLQDEFPDVTISKIRFLESQGLLDPERTPSGYRKFYDADLRRLRYILVQQRDHFLPLKVIKERLDAGAHLPPPGGSATVEPPGGSAGDAAEAAADRGDPDAGTRAGERADVGPEAGMTPANGSEPPVPRSAGDDLAGPATAAADRPAAVSAFPAPGKGSRVAASASGSGAAGSGAGAAGEGGVAVPAQATIGEGPAPADAASGVSAPAGPVVESAAAVPSGTDVDGLTANGLVGFGPDPGGAAGDRRPEDDLGVPSGSAPPGEEDAGRAAEEAAETDAGVGVDGGVLAPGGATSPAGPGRGDGRRGQAAGDGGGRRAGGAGEAPGGRAGGRHRAAATSTRAPGGDLTSVSFSLTELAGAAGLEVSELRELERYGVVCGQRVGADTVYGDDALAAAQVAAKFRRHGIEARHLRSYRMAADREAGLFEQVVAPQLRARNQGPGGGPSETLDELEELGDSLRHVLVRRALRTLLDGG